MANNGHDPGRLDRLEGLVEVLFNRHLEFEEEHKRLLIAQVVLTGRIDRLAELQTETAERMNRAGRHRRRGHPQAPWRLGRRAID
jgi:hypothetical protein